MKRLKFIVTVTGPLPPSRKTMIFILYQGIHRTSEQYCTHTNRTTLEKLIPMLVVVTIKNCYVHMRMRAHTLKHVCMRTHSSRYARTHTCTHAHAHEHTHTLIPS